MRKKTTVIRRKPKHRFGQWKIPRGVTVTTFAASSLSDGQERQYGDSWAYPNRLLAGEEDTRNKR